MSDIPSNGRLMVGIDLGTTNSVIGHVVNGYPEVITPENDSPLVPSVVLIDPSQRLIVGQDAQSALVAMPDRTVAAIKRKMGDPGSVSIAGKEYTPQEISAFILRELRQRAAAVHGDIEMEAVITVPAYFNEAQRRATKEAGELAGFVVERIINEPTAAALAFGFRHSAGQRSLLVYDLGGGTFDVSVVALTEGILEVKASTGNRHLGGEDFDWKLVDWMAEHVVRRYDVDPRTDLRARALLKEAAERLKCELSDSPTASVSMPVLLTRNGEPISLNIRLDRDRFEEMIRPWIDETMQSVTDVLAESRMDASAIDEVLLVGGSTRIPLVRERLAQRFGKPPRVDVDPDLAVVLGATVQAGLKSGALTESGLIVTDVAPFSMGIAVAQPDWMGRWIPGHFHPIIPKNTTIPVTRTDRFTTVQDDQTEIRVEIFQGEGRMVHQNYSLGSFLFSGLPSAIAHKESLEVTFHYNLNGMLEVTARSVSTGKKMALTVHDALDRQSAEALEESKRRVEDLWEYQVDDNVPDMGHGEELLLDEELETVENAVASEWEEAVQQAKHLRERLQSIIGSGRKQKMVNDAVEGLSRALQNDDLDDLLRAVDQALDLLIDLEI